MTGNVTRSIDNMESGPYKLDEWNTGGAQLKGRMDLPGLDISMICTISFT